MQEYDLKLYLPLSESLDIEHAYNTRHPAGMNPTRDYDEYTLELARQGESEFYDAHENDHMHKP